MSDTSPIFNLSAIGQLQLLAQQFEVILIPTAVCEELEPIRATPAGLAIEKGIEQGLFRVVPVHDRTLVQSFQMSLDRGEAEAVALALEQRLQRILLDEKDGRRVAREMGLAPVGVLGILLRAKQAGRLRSVKASLIALQEEAGFYLAPSLVAQVVALAGES